MGTRLLVDTSTGTMPEFFRIIAIGYCREMAQRGETGHRLRSGMVFLFEAGYKAENHENPDPEVGP